VALDHVNVAHPIASQTRGNYDLEGFKRELGKGKPKRPFAFVYGTGLWNHLDTSRSEMWIDEIDSLTLTALPHLNQTGELWPRLMITPGAGGIKKPEDLWLEQGNDALARFEKDMVKVLEKRDQVDHLGTWNMSIQSTSWDGT
jgi:hypothetical protein